MKLKTISGHYGTAYNLSHNNRDFIPKNVDHRRIPWNYNCVAAGMEAYLDIDDPRCINEFWARYRELNEMYWEERSIAQTLAYEKYQEHLRYMRMYSRSLYPISHGLIEALITLMLLPLLVPCDIYLSQQQKKAKEEWEEFKREQLLRDLTYKATRVSLRDALYEYDYVSGTKYLQSLDRAVKELGIQAQNHQLKAVPVVTEYKEPLRFATVEEIYGKLYEPSFQEFQQKQRPCRRYQGTYLEQIREGQAQEKRKKQQSKNARSRKTAEAIEIVFGLGDKDNTGYEMAYDDARQSEELLKDFADRLMFQPNMCCVTTKELNDPMWRPPFENGLIILNLTVHADEATPGVHLTCIPYSRNCRRGPKVQAALGRAMAGMGYPSTWKDAVDENGERIPKRDREGNVIHNKNGSVRFRQEPDKQGIIDWVEDQKRWLQQEMKKRYDWDREYKGAHPRGNLSTPDYQAARAKERLEEHNQLFFVSLQQYRNRVDELTDQLEAAIDRQWKNATTRDIIDRYLRVCTDEEYNAFVDTAANYLDKLVMNEQERLRLDLAKQMQKAAAKKKETSKNKGIQSSEKAPGSYPKR